MMVLGGELADVVLKRYGDIDYEWGISSASTDFVSRTKMTHGIELKGFRREILPTVMHLFSSSIRCLLICGCQ